jgi:hypothetical protein
MMFLHDQLNGSFTWAELLLALLISVAPLAVTILVKVMLYRRYRVGDEDGLLAAAAERIANAAAEGEGVTRLREDAATEWGVRPITDKEGGKPAMGNRSTMMTAAGHAELGHRVGDKFEWAAPGG